ncbi:MAG: trimeric intracellular cation channel family protein [Rudaea sp.]
MHTLVSLIDLIGTFVFAISGATIAIRRDLDLFGVLVLSFAAATAGGICRDVLIGAIPPAALTNLWYLGVSCVAGILTFYRYADVERMRNPVQIFDAAGLALFAVTGATKALEFHLEPVSAILLGMLTGIGGGIARDVLVAQVPVVLRADFYAMAALIGAAVVVIGHELQFAAAPSMAVGALLCFALRFMAIRRGWRLPSARVKGPSKPGQGDSAT